MTTAEKSAECRYCGLKLDGAPYHLGKPRPMHPDRKNGKVRVNYYGGYVCSYRCDVLACSDLEQSMPGHGWSSNRSFSALDRNAQQRIQSNWPEEFPQ